MKHAMMRPVAGLVLATFVFAITTVAQAAAAETDQTVRFEAARVHLQKGRVEEALEVYEELSQTKADATKVALGKSRAHEVLGQWKQATTVLEQGVKAVPESALLWARLAEVQFRQGRYEAAEKSIAEALKRDDSQPLARLVQADVFTETGRVKQAGEAYRWFVRYYNRAQPEDAETLLLIARGTVQYARWNSVSQIFGFAVNTLCPDALKADKLSWQAYSTSGSLLLEKYNRAQALPEFRSALAINPRASVVLVSLGRASFQQHDLEEADEYADRALKTNPRFVPALQLKADVKLINGNLKAAEKLVRTALAVNPHEQRTLARLAACYLLADGPPPDDQLDELLSNLDAIENISIEKPGRFAKVLIELAQRNPRPGYFLTILGNSLESRRQYAVAERLYKSAMTSMPQLAEPKTALGMLYMRVGKIESAGKLLDEAFKADPFHVRVSNMRKVIKLLKGYRAITTDHFVIRVDSEADKLLGRYMAEYLEEIYPELVKQFGYEPPLRTQFEIYHNAKGLSAHQWFSARMIGLPWIQTIGASTGVIVALASPTAAEKPFNWARVLKHEFVHVITLQQTNFNIPHWFTEALAVSSEGYPRPELWNKLLLERVPLGELSTLDNLNDGFIRPKSQMDWQFAYCQSRLYAQFMVEKYGAETIPKLLEAYRKNLPTDRAIAAVFGVDQKTFEKKYREYLDALVADLRGAQPEQKKTLAELEKAHLADPENSQAAAEYAHALFQLRKRKQARKLAGKALEQNAAEPLAAIVMARLELRAQDLAQAAKFLEPALDRKKPHRDVLKLLARVKLLDARNAEAAELYELGVKKFPYDTEIVRGLAAVYINLDDPTKLKSALHTLSQMDADNAVVRAKLAELALEEQDYRSAVKFGRMALHVDVLDVDVHRILAEAYRGLKKNDRAIQEYKVALELEPDETTLEWGLAQAYAADGKKTKAKARLQNILKRQPDHAAARKLLEGLD
jgi:tetratricopeptide (TPR) repeat protein